MDLKLFAREMTKDAGFVRWLTTSKIRPKLFGSQAKPAKELIEEVGSKLTREQADRLHHIAGGGAHPKARSIVKEIAKAHDARKTSLKKPAAIGAIGLGTYLGARKAQESNRSMRMVDRSPQLTQDPSRYVY